MTNSSHPESGRRRIPAFQRRLFTLVELSVVLLILSIMLTAGMPALTSLAQGRSVDTAARTIQSALRQARMQAITGRQYVAVLLPGTNKITDSSGTDLGCSFTSYRLCLVNKPTAATATFSDWVPGSKLEYVPTGSLIGYVTTSATIPSSDTTDTITINDPLFKGDCRAVIFKPSGRVRQNEDLYIYLVEGAGTPSSTTKNIIKVKVEATTGKASITE